MERGLTVSEVARRAGTAPAQVRVIERGARAANLVTLESLARALGVPLVAFLSAEVKTIRPARADRAFIRLVALLRDRDAADLKAIEGMVLALDRATERARSR